MSVGPAQVIYEWAVASGTPLYTLMGTRFWHGRKPGRVSWENDTPAGIFTLSGDGGPYTRIYRSVGLSARVYGGSDNSDDTEALYEAFCDRFGGATGEATASGVIERCEHVGDGVLLEDPKLKWFYMVARFELDVTLT